MPSMFCISCGGERKSFAHPDGREHQCSAERPCFLATCHFCRADSAEALSALADALSAQPDAAITQVLASVLGLDLDHLRAEGGAGQPADRDFAQLLRNFTANHLAGYVDAQVDPRDYSQDDVSSFLGMQRALQALLSARTATEAAAAEQIARAALRGSKA